MPFTTTNEFEPNPDIILVFHGLMALSQRNSPNQQFEFGCHGGNGARAHSLKIRIGYLDPFGGFTELPQDTPGYPIPVNRGDIFEFDVVGDANISPTPIDVYNLYKDEKSFSSVIDIENKYKKKVSKTNPTFSNLIKVKKGLLYTKALTSSTFRLLERNETVTPVAVAAQIAINVCFNGGEGVLKKISPAPSVTLWNFPQNQSETHVIFFDNDCEETEAGTTRKCRWDPGHVSDRTKRNDFYLNYENVIDNTKINGKEYKLIMQPGSGNGRIKSTHPPEITVPYKSGDNDEIKTSNDAPCTSEGYGKTNGWDPPDGNP